MPRLGPVVGAADTEMPEVQSLRSSKAVRETDEKTHGYRTAKQVCWWRKHRTLFFLLFSWFFCDIKRGTPVRQLYQP